MRITTIANERFARFFSGFWRWKNCSAASLAVRSGFPGSLATLFRLLDGQQNWNEHFAKPLAMVTADELSVPFESLWEYLIGVGEVPASRVTEIELLTHWHAGSKGSQEFLSLIESHERNAAVSISFMRLPEGWLLRGGVAKRLNDQIAEELGGNKNKIVGVLTEVDQHLRWRFVHRRATLPKSIQLYVCESDFRNFCTSVALCSTSEDNRDDWIFWLIEDAVMNRGVVIGLIDDQEFAAWQHRQRLERFDSVTVIDHSLLLCSERHGAVRGWIESGGDEARNQYIETYHKILRTVPTLVGHTLDASAMRRSLCRFL